MNQTNTLPNTEKLVSHDGWAQCRPYSCNTAVWLLHLLHAAGAPSVPPKTAAPAQTIHTVEALQG
jgi:hypothetical protein